MIRALAVCAASALLCSCTNVIWVKQKKTDATGDPQKIAGLPFYVKVEKVKQTTVYAKPWLRATLTVEIKLRDTKEGKEVLIDSGKQTFVRDVLKTNASLDEVRKGIVAAHRGTVDDALRLIGKFTDIPSISNDTDVQPVCLKNIVEREWIVDQSQTYYLNAPLPWFGSGNLNQELNSDGTLSKASSNPDTKLAEGISTLIPLKEFLTGKFVKSAESAAADDSTKADTKQAFNILKQFKPDARLAEAQYVYILSLEVVEIGHQYELKKPLPKWPESSFAPINFAEIVAGTVMFTMTDLGTSDKGDKKDGAKVGIEGSITFPKDWGAAKADK